MLSIDLGYCKKVQQFYSAGKANPQIRLYTLHALTSDQPPGVYCFYSLSKNYLVLKKKKSEWRDFALNPKVLMF